MIYLGLSIFLAVVQSALRYQRMLGYHSPLRVFFARVAMGNSFVPRDFCFLFVFVCCFVSVITVDNGSSPSFCHGY